MAAGGAPVGACLVRNGVVVSRGQNSVVASLDITAHAEMVVIREACRDLQVLSLADCQLYVTLEPCAMCMAACAYAGIAQVYFGAGIDIMHAITANEVPAIQSSASGGAHMPDVTGGILEAECIALLQAWSSSC